MALCGILDEVVFPVADVEVVVDDEFVELHAARTTDARARTPRPTRRFLHEAAELKAPPCIVPCCPDPSAQVSG
jgi:hypothetical protein